MERRSAGRSAMSASTFRAAIPGSRTPPGTTRCRAPETRALAELMTSHGEIAAVVVLGTRDNLLSPWKSRPGQADGSGGEDGEETAGRAPEDGSRGRRSLVCGSLETVPRSHEPIGRRHPGSRTGRAETRSRGPTSTWADGRSDPPYGLRPLSRTRPRYRRGRRTREFPRTVRPRRKPIPRSRRSGPPPGRIRRTTSR